MNAVSLATLRGKIRSRGEVRSAYISDTDLTQWINDSIKDLFDRILTVNQDWWIRVSDTISVVSDQERYPLPADFAHLRRVEILYQSPDDWRPLWQFNLPERAFYPQVTPANLYWRYRVMDDSIWLAPIPKQSADMRLWYIPTPPQFKYDADEIDFVYGWDEYVVLDCCEKAAIKEESDAGPFLQKKMDVLDRILTRASTRNVGEPNTIRNDSEELYFARYPWVKTT